MAKATGPARLIGFIFNLIGKYGPGIVSDIQGLAGLFGGHPAAEATPAAAAVATDLNSAKDSSNAPLSLADVSQIVDKHNLKLSEEQKADLHKTVTDASK